LVVAHVEGGATLRIISARLDGAYRRLANRNGLITKLERHSLFVSAAASCEARLSRICCRTLVKKLLSDFCHNLRISHLVGWFDTYYVSAGVVFLQSFFELALCLTGTKYQNRFCLTNA
jgi:hypothetical protein